MTFTTRMLTPETWDDFAALVEASNGVWGGCWCMGFHPEGVGAGRTRDGNREAKRRHVTDGTVRQVLVYDGDRCVGWCQFGSPPELPNINNRRTYDRGAGGPPDWRIGCIFTNAKDRGKGVAAAAVAAALEEVKRAAAALSRPIRSRPGSGRRSVAPICTQDRRSCMRNTASRGYGRSRSGGGSCAPRSDPRRSPPFSQGDASVSR